MNQKEEYYLHKALRMPQFSIGIYNLLVWLKAFSASWAKHMVQWHAEADVSDYPLKNKQFKFYIIFLEQTFIH